MLAATVELPALWSAAGFIVGFQVTAVTLRINREIAVGDRGVVTWLPPADLLNLVSLVVTLIGVFAAPALSVVSPDVAQLTSGFAVVLLAGYPLALAGHYEDVQLGFCEEFLAVSVAGADMSIHRRYSRYHICRSSRGMNERHRRARARSRT
jgi:hypothetical protein